MADLGRLCAAGVRVTIRGDQAAIGKLTAPGLQASDRITLQVDGSYPVLGGRSRERC